MECIMKLTKWDSLAQNTLVEVDNDLNLLLDDTVPPLHIFNLLLKFELVPRSVLGLLCTFTRESKKHVDSLARLYRANTRSSGRALHSI